MTNNNTVASVVASASDKEFINNTVVARMDDSHIAITVYNNIDGCVSVSNEEPVMVVAPVVVPVIEKPVVKKTVLLTSAQKEEGNSKDALKGIWGKVNEHKQGEVMEKVVFEDENEEQATCSNFNCVSRDKAVILKGLYSDIRIQSERLRKGQEIMRKSYSSIVKQFGMGVVTGLPTVNKGQDIVLSKYENITVEDDFMMVDMLTTRLMYTHYKKSGEVNTGTKGKFTSHYGYTTGVQKFNDFAASSTTFNKYLSLAFNILSVMKEIGSKIKEAKDMDNVPAYVTVESVYDEDGIRTKVCPHCGAEVTVYKGAKYNQDATKDMVEKELKNETYNLGNGRIVTLDSNGNIVDDTAADACVSENDIVPAMINMSEPTDMSVFGGTTSKVEFYDTSVAGYKGNEYKESLITEDDVQDMWSMGGEVSDEEIVEYNNIIKSHGNTAKWNKFRNAYGVLESGELTRATIGKDSVAGGWLRDDYNYEVNTLNEIGTELGINIKSNDTVDAWAIKCFYDNVGKAFVGNEVSTFTKRNGTSFTKVENMWSDIHDGLMSMESYTDYVGHSEERSSRKPFVTGMPYVARRGFKARYIRVCALMNK